MGPVVEPVIVAPEIDQEYEAPLCAGTLAKTAFAPSATKDGAVMVASGGFWEYMNRIFFVPEAGVVTTKEDPVLNDEGRAQLETSQSAWNIVYPATAEEVMV